MRLKYAKIINFRSIQEMRVDFDPSCRILVGINESGKSNILRALSMIGEDFSPTAEDVREPLPRERPIEEAYIWFVFGLDKADMDEIYAKVKPKLLSKKEDATLMTLTAKVKGTPTKFNYSLKRFADTRNEGLYTVDVEDGSKSGSYWTVAGYTVLPNWKKPSKACPADFTVDVGGVAKPLNGFSLINTDDYAEIPAEYLEPIDTTYVNRVVGSEISDFIEESLPEVIFWRYEENNLLPPSIDMDAFAANPDTCIPLKNMFMLAGITDIGKELAAARAVSTTKVRNLLSRVATQATTHFRSVWKEHKEIRFALEPNGNTIDANIVEKNHWKMSQRSDGIKRFITFLLYISANIKANLLTDALLLVDEPDMGLHPSGSRYLRDELIDNSKKNTVVFSTHSIFMIDKENIGRHLLVKKDSEKTTILNANTSNFVDEEVLYNALNYTVFDILKQNNIIFEGWRDKKLFQVAMSRIATGYATALKPLSTKLKSSLGICHAEGVKDVRNLTPLIELAGRTCLIVSDADKAAKEKQKEFQEDLRGFGTWKRYDEILTTTKAQTGEDFLTDAAFTAGITALKKKYPALTGDPAKTTSGRLDEVRKWLGAQGIPGDQHKEMLNFLKTSLFDALVPAHIENEYYDLLKELVPVIGGVK